MPRDPPSPLSAVAKYIKKHLAAKRRLEGREWSQNHLARKAGLTGGGLSMILTGKVQPKAETLISIAEVLGVDSTEILTVAGLIDIEQEVNIYDPILLQSMRKIDRLPKDIRRHAVSLVKQLADTLEIIS